MPYIEYMDNDSKTQTFQGMSFFCGARASRFMIGEGEAYAKAGGAAQDADTFIAVEQQDGAYSEAIEVLGEDRARLAFLKGLTGDDSIDVWGEA